MLTACGAFHRALLRWYLPPGAWNESAPAVTAPADQMRDMHRTMFDSMNTATWQERRDMMNRMMEAPQPSRDSVQAAARALLFRLTPTQRATGQQELPGLGGIGPYGRGRHMQR
jgi:hypothetical protein